MYVHLTLKAAKAKSVRLSACKCVVAVVTLRDDKPLYQVQFPRYTKAGERLLRNLLGERAACAPVILAALGVSDATLTWVSV